MPNLPGQLAATGLKPPLHGVGPRSGPGSAAFQATWRQSMGFYVIKGSAGDGSFVTWSELQTTLAQNMAGTLVANNAIDQAITEMNTWNGTAGNAQQALKLRVAAGIQSPAWSLNLDGTAANPSNFQAIQTNPNQPPQQGTCPAFWYPNYRTAWYRFTAALIAKYDTSPVILDMVGGPMMTLYSEPMLRQITGGPSYGLTLVNKGYFAENAGAQRATSVTTSYAPDGVLSNTGSVGKLSSSHAALVSGDVGSLVVGVGIPYGTTVVSVTGGVASLSNAVTAATNAYVVIMGTGTISDQYLQLDDMLNLVPSAGRTGGWQHTRVGYTYNPYQGFHSDGTNFTDEAFTEIALAFLYSVAGQQTSLENNSFRYDYLSGGSQGGYVPMYAKMGSLGCINGEQTAVIAKMGPGGTPPTLAQFQACIKGIGTVENAGHVELPAGFDTKMADTQITPAQLLALGNALPTAAVVTGGATILQRVPFGSTATGTTFTVPNAATQAGSTLVLHIFTRGASASSITSISGATWTNRTSQAANAGTPFGLHATYDVINSAAKAANAFLITVSPTGSIEGVFYEIAGTLTYEGSHAVAGGTTAVSGSYTTTDATDVVIGSAGWSNGTSTLTGLPSSPWVNDSVATGVASAEGSQIQAGTILTTVTGVQTYNGTLSQASSWVVAFTAYKNTTGTVPSAPTNVTAVATGTTGQATVAWTAGYNGGSVVTSSVVTPYISGTPGTPQTLSGAGTSLTLTGLTAVLHTFTVHQVNANGAGAESALPGPSATPAAAPAAPQPPTWPATPPGTADSEVDYSWIPGDPGTAPITSYTLTISIVGGGTWLTATINDGPPPSTIYDDLTAVDGVAYTATVTATNSVGTSAASAASTAVMPEPAPSTSTVTTNYPPAAHPAISARYAALLQGKGN